MKSASALIRWKSFRLGLILGALPAAAPAPGAYRDDWARMKDIEPRHYICPRADAPLKIDGRLDDPAWRTARWTEDFVDIEGPAKPRPRFRTRAKMLWDDDYFYVAAEMEEPHVWATLTNHDAVIFQDPDFEVFIDPDGDCHDYYEFEINALNTGWDLRLPKPYKDGGPALNSWAMPGLKTAIHVQGTLNVPGDKDKGWTLELAIPWRALGEYTRQPAPPGEGDQWRVNYSRVEWRVDIADGRYRKVPGKPEDNWVWSPQGIIDMHRPEKWGCVQFTRRAVDAVKFSPDQAAPARAVLQEIYYAQKDFQKRTKKWAASLSELGLSSRSGSTVVGLPRIESTPDGFRATVEIRSPRAKKESWHIRQDAKIWSE
jgi:hypothetical protein